MIWTAATHSACQPGSSSARGASAQRRQNSKNPAAYRVMTTLDQCIVSPQPQITGGASAEILRFRAPVRPARIRREPADPGSAAQGAIRNDSHTGRSAPTNQWVRNVIERRCTAP